MIKATALVGLVGMMTLTACSKSPQDVAAVPAPESTATGPTSAPQMPEAAPQQSRTEQAATLASYLDTRSDCDQFRTQLQQAGMAAPGAATPETDMTAIMEKAKEAGCFKHP